jgi:hypothetical protein
MFTRRIGPIGLLLGFCPAAAVLLFSVATKGYSTSPPLYQLHEPFSVKVDHVHKGDRLTRSTGIVGSTHSLGVEFSAGSSVVVRDAEGNIVFAVDHLTRTTTVGKQRSRRGTFPNKPTTVERELPEGCEGAFSPYAEPDKAHIIGRCVSSISPSNEVS